MQRLKEDKLVSVCPFHENCLEGLASGTAIEKRCQQQGSALEPSHPVWEIEAEYIAQGLVQMIYVLAPDRIVIGGGVMKQKHLIEIIRKKVELKLNGYTFYDRLKKMEDFIISPQLGDDAGLVGGLVLAQQA